MQSPLALHLGSALLLATTLTPLSDVFVDQAATNCATGTGTALDPVCTIPAAIAMASAGDTIHIAPGTYTGQNIIPFNLTLVGTGGQALTFLDGGSINRPVRINSGARATLDGLTIQNGDGFELGGGILVLGDLTLLNSTVARNTTSFNIGVWAGGAGIAAPQQGSTVTIDGCAIHANSTVEKGGGILSVSGNLTISNTTISNNESTPFYYRGGGIYTAGSLVKISNTTISNNQAQYGAGLHIRNPLPGSIIMNSSITGNAGTYMPVFVGRYPQPVTQMDIHNTVVAQNTFMPATPFLSSLFPNASAELSGLAISLGHNFIGAGGGSLVNGVNYDLVGTTANPLDPQLGPLFDNGGATLTHAPLPGSPLIDAGDPANYDHRDQRGALRPFGTGPDIGAVEFGGTPLPMNLCNGDGGNQAGCTDCPCGNNSPTGTIGGCLNRAGSAARLRSSGSHSVLLPTPSNEDLRFTLTGVPALSFCILTSGDSVAPNGAANPCFGLGTGTQSASFDGLRCAILNIRRHGGRAADTNGEVGVTNSPWGGEGAPPAGIAGTFGGFAAGQTRYFQTIYREDALAGCMRGLNTSQAQRILFTR